MKRRDFLKQGSGIAAGAVLGGPRLTRGATASGGGALPAWLRNAIRDGLGLYQWYKLDPGHPSARARPNSYFGINTYGTLPSQVGLVAPGEAADPDSNGFSLVDANTGLTWRQHAHNMQFNTVQTRRLTYSGTAFRRSGSVIFFHGGGHNGSCRNDVAEIHLGNDNVLRRVRTPTTQHNMIRWCLGTGMSVQGQGTCVGNAWHYAGPFNGMKGFIHGRYPNYATSRGLPKTDKFRINYYMDGRPPPTHNGFRNIFLDNQDALMRFGGGTAIGGTGATANVCKWSYAAGDWEKPPDYVSDSNYGSGVSPYGEMWDMQTYLDTGKPTYGGDSIRYPSSGRTITQPMTKLVGQDKVIIVQDGGTTGRVWQWVYPGPNFSVIGTLSGLKNFNTSPTQRAVHDPVRNRLLYWQQQYVDAPYWAYVEEQARMQAAYIDLNVAGGGQMLVDLTASVWSKCLPARQFTTNDCVAYDEHNDKLLFLMAAKVRDPRTSGFSTASGNYDTRNPLMDNARFMSAYNVNPDDWTQVTPISITPDPLYGLPPPQVGGAYFNLRYVPELKIMYYVSKNGEMHSPLSNAGEADYGYAAGPYVWIFRVG